VTTLAGLAVLHMFEVSTYGLKLKTVWKNKCKDNNNNYNNFIDLKSKHWTIIKRQNRTKLNTYSVQRRYYHSWGVYELSPIEDYNIYKDYLPLYTTVSLNVYKKYLNNSVYTVIIVLHNN
jgi:hypothetical protein